MTLFTHALIEITNTVTVVVHSVDFTNVIISRMLLIELIILGIIFFVLDIIFNIQDTFVKNGDRLSCSNDDEARNPSMEYYE